MRLTLQVILLLLFPALFAGCATKDPFNSRLREEEAARIEALRPGIEARARDILPRILAVKSSSELVQILLPIGIDREAIRKYAHSMDMIIGDSRTSADQAVQAKIGRDSASKTLGEYISLGQSGPETGNRSQSECNRINPMDYNYSYRTMGTCPGAYADSDLGLQVNWILIEAALERSQANCRELDCGKRRQSTTITADGRGRPNISIPIDLSALLRAPVDRSREAQLRTYGLELAAWRRALEVVAFPGKSLDFELKHSGY